MFKHFHTLLLIISYFAFLFLAMPLTSVGIILTFVFSILGALYIIYKKSTFKVDVKGIIPYYFSGITALYFAFRFHNKWLPSSMIRTISVVFNLSSNSFLVIISIILALFSLFFLIVVFEKINNYLSETSHNSIKKVIISCLILSALIAILSDVTIAIYSTKLINVLITSLLITSLIFIIYSLSGSIRFSVGLVSVFFMLISTVNVYVLKFRGRLFEPTDIYTVQTVVNVAENYSLTPVPTLLIVGWIVFISVLVYFLLKYLNFKVTFSFKRRIALLLCAVLVFISVFGYAFSLRTEHFGKSGALANSYLLDYVSRIKEILITEPENYSENYVADLAEKYTVDPVDSIKDYPNIIVIMNESYSDLSILGDFNTNIDVSPYFSSLKDSTVSGYALASVFGGNTSNSEYEFLTGNSMAWLSSSSTPYQQYVRSSSYSMVSYLKSKFDYKCIVMHPYYSSGWNRPNVYKNFHFDDSLFIEDFPNKDFARLFISDKEMYNKITEVYENNQGKEPLFIFGVTMQNHGDYFYTGNDFKHTVNLTDIENDYYDVEQYLTLINESDKALMELIDYFESRNEEVVILFYGDHQPRLDNSFYDEIGANNESSLDLIQQKYKVPFFVWSNYGLEDEYIDCTSINYLSNYLYETAGIPLPPYNQFLTEMEAVIPSINANGYYSLTNKCYMNFDSASGIEKEYLDTYRILQYNNLHDVKGRNNALFPILE